MSYAPLPHPGDQARMAEDGRLHRAKEMLAGWKCRWCLSNLSVALYGSALRCPKCDYPPRMTTGE